MEDNFDDEEEWSMLPPEREYPPIIPPEITNVLKELDSYKKSLERFGQILESASDSIEEIRSILDEIEKNDKTTLL